MKDPIVFWTTSSDETEKVGREIAKLLRKGDVLCLTGDLGAGKTTLVKGIAKECTGVESLDVTSPTFSYMHLYQGKENLYHFDLYRFSSSEEFLHAGFVEFISSDTICCIEWPDRLPSNLCFRKLCVHLEYLSLEQRKITFWEDQ